MSMMDLVLIPRPCRPCLEALTPDTIRADINSDWTEHDLRRKLNSVVPVVVLTFPPSRQFAESVEKLR